MVEVYYKYKQVLFSMTIDNVPVMLASFFPSSSSSDFKQVTAGTSSSIWAYNDLIFKYPLDSRLQRMNTPEHRRFLANGIRLEAVNL